MGPLEARHRRWSTHTHTQSWIAAIQSMNTNIATCLDRISLSIFIYHIYIICRTYKSCAMCYVCICMYIKIYTERQREKTVSEEREREWDIECFIWIELSDAFILIIFTCAQCARAPEFDSDTLTAFVLDVIDVSGIRHFHPPRRVSHKAIRITFDSICHDNMGWWWYWWRLSNHSSAACLSLKIGYENGKWYGRAFEMHIAYSHVPSTDLFISPLTVCIVDGLNDCLFIYIYLRIYSYLCGSEA